MSSAWSWPGGGNDERERNPQSALIKWMVSKVMKELLSLRLLPFGCADPASLLCWLFGQKSLVGRPDVKGREAILRVHMLRISHIVFKAEARTKRTKTTA